MIVTVETQAQIISLYCGGATYAEIARQTGIGAHHLRAVLLRNGINPRPRGPKPRRKHTGGAA